MDDFDVVTLNVRMWVANWASAIDGAKVRRSVVTEQLHGRTDLLDEKWRHTIADGLIRRLRRQTADRFDGEGLLVLAEDQPRVTWGEHGVQVEVLYLTIDRPAVPPVDEWRRFG